MQDFDNDISSTVVYCDKHGFEQSVRFPVSYNAIVLSVHLPHSAGKELSFDELYEVLGELRFPNLRHVLAEEYYWKIHMAIYDYEPSILRFHVPKESELSDIFMLKLVNDFMPCALSNVPVIFRVPNPFLATIQYDLTLREMREETQRFHQGR